MSGNSVEPIRLKSCLKVYAKDLDKAVPPAETFANVSQKLAAAGLEIFAGAKRVDIGRLGIPVYAAICGQAARGLLPGRKQMGKGSSRDQARASALMELVERHAFFSFFERRPNFVRATWREAEGMFGDSLIPLAEMALSVSSWEHSGAAPTIHTDGEAVREILDLRAWDFYPATRLVDGRLVWLPLDWFRMLGEFNGSSAGNTREESILQGLCELVERHTCCQIDQKRPLLPTIDPKSARDPVLEELIAAFEREGIFLLLKDISLGLPLPGVAALAYDPATFPGQSEIVFTAGVATSPEKAAIRAITEVAQLGGDFCTSSCYEASGLPKFTTLDEFAWLLAGPSVSLHSLPNIAANDFRDEISRVIAGLAPLSAYAVETTHPAAGINAHYCIVPGLTFRERDRNQSIGLFTGRKLAEEGDAQGLEKLAALCPEAHYLPFFRGLLALGEGRPETAAALFAEAIPRQPDAEARAMALFYLGHAKTAAGDWSAALAPLREAFRLCPGMKEYGNLLGAALYREKNYGEAEKIFSQVLKIDKGSAIDLANRGICRKFLGRKEEARADLEEALALDSSLDFARGHLEELQDG